MVFGALSGLAWQAVVALAIRDRLPPLWTAVAIFSGAFLAALSAVLLDSSLGSAHIDTSEGVGMGTDGGDVQRSARSTCPRINPYAHGSGRGGQPPASPKNTTTARPSLTMS
jgi:hypothetical protein